MLCATSRYEERGVPQYYDSAHDSDRVQENSQSLAPSVRVGHCTRLITLVEMSYGSNAYMDMPQDPTSGLGRNPERRLLRSGELGPRKGGQIMVSR